VGVLSRVGFLTLSIRTVKCIERTGSACYHSGWTINHHV